MRQLKFARRRTPAEETEAAEALRWLKMQAVPAEWPSDLYATELVLSFRYIVSFAKQYQHCESSILKLVMAGYHAGLVSLPNEPGKRLTSWNWWVREGMLMALIERPAGTV